MVCDAEELLDILICEFEGQKVCVEGAEKKHLSFLNRLNEKVYLIYDMAKFSRASVVGLLCFGKLVQTDKKAFYIANDFIQAAASKEFLICTTFLDSDIKTLTLVVSNFAVCGFNHFSRLILETGFAGDNKEYFECLNKILELSVKNDMREAGRILNTLQGLEFCTLLHEEKNAFEQNVSAVLYLNLCEHFIDKKPFTCIFNYETLSESFGIFHQALPYDTEEICYKLKEFAPDLGELCSNALNTASNSFKVYKRTQSDASYNEIKNLNAEIAISKMLKSGTVCKGFSFLSIIQNLGLV